MFFHIGHTIKPHKDDVEKHRSKKTAQSSYVIGVKKDKSNNDSKKHNESNSMLHLILHLYFPNTKVLVVAAHIVVVFEVVLHTVFHMY